MVCLENLTAQDCGDPSDLLLYALGLQIKTEKQMQDTC